MKILGIDYGRRKIGIAFAEGSISAPLRVIKVENINDAAEKVKKVFNEMGAEKIVVGVSEGEMGTESKKFAGMLNAETFDETLSTYEAQRLSREGGVKRKKRKEMEDAYAASIMLQNYLDSR